MLMKDEITFEGKELCTLSFLALAIMVPLGLTLVRYPHQSEPFVFLEMCNLASTIFLSLGIVFFLIAGEQNEKSVFLVSELERNAPWPAERKRELHELIRRQGESEHRAWLYNWRGTELCKAGLVWSLINFIPAAAFAAFALHS